MTIRSLHTDDYSQWLVLWQDYLHFYQTTLEAQVSESTWRRILDSGVPVYGFAAFDEAGQMLGFVHCVIHPNTWNQAPVCYLEDLLVKENARKQGIGRGLIEHVYQFAAAYPCSRVYWHTDRDNHSAQRLYRTVARETGMIQFRHDIAHDKAEEE